MIRRAGNERRVLLDGHGYGLLQFVLAFHHLRRLVNDRHEFSFLLLSLWPDSTRAKHMANRGFPCSLGWSDRHGFRGNEVGSLQPSPVFCPRPKATAASSATSMYRATSVRHKGERKSEPQREPCRSCFVHPQQPRVQSTVFGVHSSDCFRSTSWTAQTGLPREGSNELAEVKDSSACLLGLVGRRGAVPPARRRKPASAEPLSRRRGIK